jgi:hypothetical protein
MENEMTTANEADLLALAKRFFTAYNEMDLANI